MGDDDEVRWLLLDGFRKFDEESGAMVAGAVTGPGGVTIPVAVTFESVGSASGDLDSL